MPVLQASVAPDVFTRRTFAFLIIDAADAVGGRIRTDVIDGFRLDRGFQVFLTSYPGAQQVLDYQALGHPGRWCVREEHFTG